MGQVVRAVAKQLPVECSCCVTEDMNACDLVEVTGTGGVQDISLREEKVFHPLVEMRPVLHEEHDPIANYCGKVALQSSMAASATRPRRPPPQFYRIGTPDWKDTPRTGQQAAGCPGVALQCRSQDAQLPSQSRSEEAPRFDTTAKASLAQRFEDVDLKTSGIDVPPTSSQSSGLRMSFSFEGEVHSVDFHKKPLGFGFRNEKPHLVEKVAAGSHGDCLGVRVGWNILKVDDEDVTQCEWTELLNKILTATKHLPDCQLREDDNPKAD